MSGPVILTDSLKDLLAIQDGGDDFGDQAETKSTDGAKIKSTEAD